MIGFGLAPSGIVLTAYSTRDEHDKKYTSESVQYDRRVFSLTIWSSKVSEMLSTHKIQYDKDDKTTYICQLLNCRVNSIF